MTGVVSAASVWGSYKGNDIIRITSNGVALKTSDVPAISYNGRTMIPISMLGQIGIGYNWDQANKTVDVSNNSSNNLGIIESDESTIKDFIKNADFFNKLRSLGDSLTLVSSAYSLAYDEMYAKKVNSYLTTANKQLNGTIDSYNSILNESKNYSDSSISLILNDYYTAIDNYKNMDSSLSKYFYSNSQSDFDNYLNGSKYGFNSTFSGKQKAINGYNKYINLALNN